MKCFAFIRLVRPANALLSAAGVALGFWLTGAPGSAFTLGMLIIATVCTLGWGNVINDIKDLEGDRINHPRRPLPSGELTSRTALLFGAALAFTALTASYSVSPVHCAAAAVPILALALYTLLLKNTPLAGNYLVSALVAYTLIFGSINAPDFRSIVIPAILAFLLNLCREIVKDLEDRKGDSLAGLNTTASLPGGVIRTLVIVVCGAYAALLFLPAIRGDFGMPYLLICTVLVLPLHTVWFIKFLTQRTAASLGSVSLLLKIEMACGLAALAADALITY